MNTTEQRPDEGREVLTLADGHRLPLHGEELYIGRAPTNEIVLDDQMIASRHARLLRYPEGWLLMDLKSKNGTAVNGQPLTHPVFLVPGDVIRLGRLVVTLRHAEDVDNARPLRRAGDAPGRATRLLAQRPGAPVVDLRNVVKTYETSAGPVTVLREVSLAVQPGEFVAIVGPSGCGKSTLLNVITGIDRPDAGEVIVGGQDIRRIRDEALVSWRGRTVGIVFQFFQLLPTLTVAENVMLPMAFCQTYPGRERRARALAVLGRVSMDHMADRLPSVLSGGEQQRVAIARALANAPPVLVADEPTGNLDGQTGRQIFELFAGLVASGTTVLMVTHDPVLAANVPRRVEMHDGRIVGAT